MRAGHTWGLSGSSGPSKPTRKSSFDSNFGATSDGGTLVLLSSEPTGVGDAERSEDACFSRSFMVERKNEDEEVVVVAGRARQLR